MHIAIMKRPRKVTVTYTYDEFRYVAQAANDMHGCMDPDEDHTYFCETVGDQMKRALEELE